MIGQTLGHYRIDSKLGEGGMGVVYKALDTHLDRTVAIKVLRPAAVADPEKKRRFVQEAKAASALSHPSIITIYDIDNDQGVDFIAMEYVDGGTLHDWIHRGKVDMAECLHHAVQMADALARAHGAGIVHRDLKPGNIMVTAAEGRPGLVKLLDFGMAKLTESAVSDATLETQGAGMTEPPRTADGSVVGTFAYMSPEQAEGKKVDARSDIFSFGAVLYEMATGRRAFDADGRIVTLFAIVREDPQPIRHIAKDVPPELETIIARCLRKDPRRRFQVMEDVRIALEDIQEAMASTTASAGSRSGRTEAGRRWLFGAAIAMLAIALTAGIRLWPPERRHRSRPLVLTRLTSETGLAGWPALSPDGKLLAYASDRSGEGNLDIWLQQVVGGDPIRLTRQRSDAREPAFSPDGTKIAFRSEYEGGGIYVVPMLGGEPRLIARHGRRPRFSPDGKWIAYWVRDETWAPSKSYVVPAGGGTPTQLQPEFADAHYPIWSPNGTHLLFCGTRDPNQPQEQGHDWWVTPLEPGAAIKTGAVEAFGRLGLLYAARDISGTGIPNDPGDWFGNEILFSARLGDGVNLWQVPISQKNWKLAGEPERLTVGSGGERHPSVSGSHVVFESGPTEIDIQAVPLDARRGQPLGEPQPIIRRPASYDAQPSVSGDGKKLAFISNRSGNRDVWLKDLQTGSEIALTNTPALEGYPKISRDGSKVLYRVIENPKQVLYVISSSGGPPEKVCDDCGLPTDWSLDGQKVLFEPGTRVARLAVFDMVARQKSDLLQPVPYGLHAARFSPDGRWIAYHADNGPFTRQILIASFRSGTQPGEKEWIPVTDGTAMDHTPYWSPSGDLLYFLSERDGFRCVWARRLNVTTKSPVGAAFAVRHFHAARSTLLMNVVASPWEVGLSVTPKMMFFSLDELAGNVWMAELQPET